mmetsp:Transcript_167058/g.536432  ORF Transcript_167058/g.536432 Transcript_167058/m.536432 type:complete len:255 (+) Transcript_167058:1788-2552(+)
MTTQVVLPCRISFVNTCTKSLTSPMPFVFTISSTRRLVNPMSRSRQLDPPPPISEGDCANFPELSERKLPVSPTLCRSDPAVLLLEPPLPISKAGRDNSTELAARLRRCNAFPAAALADAEAPITSFCTSTLSGALADAEGAGRRLAKAAAFAIAGKLPKLLKLTPTADESASTAQDFEVWRTTLWSIGASSNLNAVAAAVGGAMALLMHLANAWHQLRKRPSAAPPNCHDDANGALPKCKAYASGPRASLTGS